MLKFHNFQITENAGKLNFYNLATGQEKNVVPVVYADGIVFQVLKNRIKSMYTATELLTKLQKFIDSDFCTAYISIICRAYVGEIDYSF